MSAVDGRAVERAERNRVRTRSTPQYERQVHGVCHCAVTSVGSCSKPHSSNGRCGTGSLWCVTLHAPRQRPNMGGGPMEWSGCKASGVADTHTELAHEKAWS